MIDKSKFLEPTEAYAKENILANENPKIAKDWFNIDLIFFAMQYKNKDYQQAIKVQEGYQEFCDIYDIKLTSSELNELFGDYPKTEFDELVIETMAASKEIS